MNTTIRTLLFVSLIIGIILPNATVLADPPRPDDCLEFAQPGCPGSWENPLDPRYLHGKYVEVLRYVGIPPTEGDQRIQVRVEGQTIWTKAGIGIQLYPAKVENGITGREYFWGPPYDLSFDDKVKEMPEDFQGIWTVEREYPPYDFVKVFAPYESTRKDGVIDALWAEFITRIPSDLRENLWDDSPYARSVSMLQSFWHASWPKGRYDQIHRLITGKDAPRDGNYYEAIYGMDGWWLLPDDAEGVAVVSFATLPERATVVGELCHQKQMPYLRDFWFDHVEAFEDVPESRQSYIGQFEITPEASAVFVHGDNFYDLPLVDRQGYVSVVPADVFPDWGEASGPDVMPWLEVWRVCDE